jgi:hypothetical protein
MKIALIGFPQAGKKTLFTLLTGRKVNEGRKAGEAVEGVASIRDPRVSTLAGIFKPQRTVYAENRFVLCPDAVVGQGDRDWLRAAGRGDLLCLVVRAFESNEVYHPAGSVDAQRDRKQLEEELVFSDLEIVDKRLTRLAKEKRAGRPAAQAIEEAALRKCLETLEAGRRLAELTLDKAETAAILSLDLITRLPLLCVYNVPEAEVARPVGPSALAVSARIEAEIAEIEEAGERREYLASLGLSSPGLDRMNQAAYDALGLMSFYTVGEDEVRAWTIRKGALAPEAGGKVHTDIERGFIRVEVIKFDDLVAAGSEQAAKKQGLMQTRGRDYVIEDGDICNFLFSV